LEVKNFGSHLKEKSFDLVVVRVEKMAREGRDKQRKGGEVS